MEPTICRGSEAVGRAPRVLAYCHDGVGLGHLRRTLNICTAVGATHPSASFLVATGSPYTCLFPHGPRLDFLKLPAITKLDNDTYLPKYLGLSAEEMLRCRESLLLETARHFEPDVVLVDKAPVGVRGELSATLRWLREHRPAARTIFGMRDIDDEPEVTIRQWSALGVPDALETLFDEVWVYGLQAFYDVAGMYRLSAAVRKKLRFMGYLTQRSCPHAPSARTTTGDVLVTVGGGTDGEMLLDAFLASSAATLSQAGIWSVIVGGPDLPRERAASLRARAARIPRLEWLNFESCMLCRIRDARLVVSMGGYNTLCEVALNRKPALVVPRTRPRVEQAIRAELWSKRGIVDTLHPESMTPASLERRILGLLERVEAPAVPAVDLGGLERVLERFDAFWQGERLHAAPVCV